MQIKSEFFNFIFVQNGKQTWLNFSIMSICRNSTTILCNCFSTAKQIIAQSNLKTKIRASQKFK